MAGLSGRQAIVDMVAAAERLKPSAQAAAEREVPAEPAGRLEVAAAVPTEIGTGEVVSWPACALGHQNHPDARFCASCGLQMGAPVPGGGAEPMRPKPGSQLTPAERAERERQHAEAVAAAAAFERSQPAGYLPSEGEAVLIHFVADGLTAFGQVWYRGQELEIGPGHPRWPEAVGWITLTRFQQVDRWGEQKFDFGPWPGRRSYADALGSFEQLAVTAPGGKPAAFSGPTEQELRAADAAEAARGRAVPAPAFG